MYSGFFGISTYTYLTTRFVYVLSLINLNISVKPLNMLFKGGKAYYNRFGYKVNRKNELILQV